MNCNGTRRRRPRRIVAGSGLLAAVALMSACGGGSDPLPADAPNVLLITIDTLRLDRLGSYGGPADTAPRIDALAAEGVLFRKVQAPRGLTWPSLTTLVTGLRPRSHQVRINGNMLHESILTLPEVLAAAGWDTGGFLSNMCDAPHRGIETFYCAWWGKDAPLETRKKRAWASHEQPEWDRSITDEADAFIRAARDRPFFAWVHYVDPHKPFDVVEEHAGDEFDGTFLPEEELIDSYTIAGRNLPPADRIQLLAVYDSQVTSTDAHIGRLLDTLAELEIADETLVILSADHGEELGDHNAYFYHLASVYQQVLSVPWIMRWPGRLPGGRVVEDDVELTDVTPTVLDMLGLEPLPDLEGTSRTGLATGAPDARGAGTVYSEWRDQMLIVGRDRWRFIWNPNRVITQGRPFSQHPGTGFIIESEELYDLEQDPLQQNSVVTEYPELVREMIATACAFLAEKPFHESAAANIPDDVLERLESLGYVQNTDAPDEGKRLVRHCADGP